MFGYINIHKDELKVKEYNMFKAYYCGLCFALKEKLQRAATNGYIPKVIPDKKKYALIKNYGQF